MKSSVKTGLFCFKSMYFYVKLGSMSIAEEIYREINKSHSIVITSHKSPDGDSIGSSLAMYHFFKKMNKEVTVVHPDPAPNFLDWVPGKEFVEDFETNPEGSKQLLQQADLIFCLDYNDSSRVGKEMQPFLDATSAVKIMIDHHLNPSDFCTWTYSFTTGSSTCELIYQWLTELDRTQEISEEMGTCLYLGVMTDTGSFRFPSVSAFTHEMIAQLIRIGVKHHLIHEYVFDTNTIDRIKLRGFALSEKLVCLDNLSVAYISLSAEELERFHYQKGDTEGLVNQILGVEGIKMAVLFMEKDGVIKISFRSKGDYFVNALANKYFEGGGHAYASGGVSNETLSETVRKFVTIVKEFIP